MRTKGGAAKDRMSELGTHRKLFLSHTQELILEDVDRVCCGMNVVCNASIGN